MPLSPAAWSSSSRASTAERHVRLAGAASRRGPRPPPPPGDGEPAERPLLRRPGHVRPAPSVDRAGRARPMEARRGRRGGSLGRLDDQPPRRPLRPAGAASSRLRAGYVPPGPRDRDLRGPRGRRLRRCPLPARDDGGVPCQHPPASRRGGRPRHLPRHPRGRPLHHVACRHGCGRGEGLGADRHRALRRPRRHGRHPRREPRQPRHPHAAPHRVGRRAGPQFRADRAARLLAAPGHLRVDAL